MTGLANNAADARLIPRPGTYVDASVRGRVLLAARAAETMAAAE